MKKEINGDRRIGSKPSIKTIEDRYDIFFLKVYIVASKKPTLFQRQLDQERQPLYINKRKKDSPKRRIPVFVLNPENRILIAFDCSG